MLNSHHVNDFWNLVVGLGDWLFEYVHETKVSEIAQERSTRRREGE